MVVLSLKIIGADGNTRYVASGENEVVLVNTSEYIKGDRICLETDTKNIFVWLSVDDGIGESMVYLTDDFSYYIPFDEKRISYSPKAFYGSRHYLTARIATEEEIHSYRNLALNKADSHENKVCFPHAFANVETRGESVFAARNAIDGVVANLSHGEWPYESWGINMQDDAEIVVDFGRKVNVDKVVLYTRADFPHDNWWVNITIEFSDGTSIESALEKSVLPHVISFETKEITWVKLCKLIKSDESKSPFPALTQIQVYGRDE